MSANVWVGGLPDGVDDETFASLFANYGTIVSSKVVTEKWYGFIEFSTAEEAANVIATLDGADFGGRTLKVKVHEKGAGKGSAKGGGKDGGKGAMMANMMEMLGSSGAKGGQKGALMQSFMEGLSFGGAGGGKGDLGQAKGGGQGDDAAPSANVWVGGLPDGIDDDSFAALFANYGTIVSSKCVPEKWYGFLTFSTEEEAANVVATLNGADFGGKMPLKVKFHEKGGGKGGGKGAMMASMMDMLGGGGKGDWGQAKGGGKGDWGPYGGGGKGPASAAGGAICPSQEGLLVGKRSDFTTGEPGSNLYVGGLPPHADKLYLYQIFAPLGSVMSTFVKTSSAGSQIGFVTYHTAVEAQYAISQVNGAFTVEGEKLKVSVQAKKDGKGKGKWG